MQESMTIGYRSPEPQGRRGESIHTHVVFDIRVSTVSYVCDCMTMHARQIGNKRKKKIKKESN